MKLPLISGRKLIKVLISFGFQKNRQEGSHVFMRHKDGRTTVVPIHSGEKIGRGLLVKIIKKDLGITKEKFIKKLK